MIKKNLIFKIFLLHVIGINILQINKIYSFIPHYKLPNKNILKNSGNELGKDAYQLLYFGQFQEGLALAKLAISLNPEDATLWALLAEAQVSNKLYDEALKSLNRGKSINPLLGELYFTESSIYLNQNKIQKAKISLKKGLSIKPKNTNALFQFGNIFLIEKEYEKALNEYKKIIKIKSNYWQAFNNKGLVYFELDQLVMAKENFERAIKIEKNAESLLALAVSLQNTNINQSILLAKEALTKNPRYVSYDFRKEQLWGNKIQKATKKLFELKELEQDINMANLYKN
tara:strand:- start:338 stop:1198 length:861 start_codon:yes stop_codon:yes gene_type:complete